MKASNLRYVLSAILIGLFGIAHAKTFLVSVGVADYSSFPADATNLRCPVNDARAIADLYAKNKGVEYVVLTDKDATKDRIVRAMSKVYSRAKADDIVVFYYSGHGFPGGFCACDGWLDYDDVKDAFANCKSKNKMIFLDTCRSGSLRADTKHRTNIEEAAKNTNVMLFLSSRTNESSFERSIGEYAIFTTQLINGLKGEADANSNSVITAKELFDFVSKKVARVSHDEQHPVMWGQFDDNMTVMKW